MFVIPFFYLCPISVASSGDDRIVVDTIFSNGNLLTLDINNSISDTIVIDNGIILRIGDAEDILADFRTLNSTYYDLEGRTMMPGIVDGHTHYIASQFWLGFDESIYDIQDLALMYGYTTLNEKSIDLDILEILQDAEQNNEIRIRLNLFLIFNFGNNDSNGNRILVEPWNPGHGPILDHRRMVRVPGVKFYTDGYTGIKGSPAMSVPYTPDMVDAWGISDPYGTLYFDPAELNSSVKEVHDQGFTCAFHAMGDRAVETALNAIKFALNGTIDDYTRHQIEHNSFLRDDLIETAKELDTIHSLRGYFPTYHQEGYEEILPTQWREWFMNRYYFLSEGVHTYLETDFAMHYYVSGDVSHSANINPFLHIWGLVTRKAIDPNGTIIEPHPWVAEHQITVEQALRMLTYEGAYAVKQEEYIGSLESGKLADIIILSDNPYTIDPDDLKDIENLLTMVGGKIEYQSNQLTLNEIDDSRRNSWISIPGYNLTFLLLTLLCVSVIITSLKINKIKKTNSPNNAA
jgi:predicted amidohydrolase YtcJ